MEDNKGIRGAIFIMIGAILIVLCLILVLNNIIEDRMAKESAVQRLTLVEEAIEKRTGEAAEASDEDDLPEEDYEMPVVFLDGYGYIGSLSLPSLDLELPVMDEWDETRLKLAPCRHNGSLETSDLVIAGHNYRSGFGRLKKINVGDEVLFTDMDGVVHSYTVEKIEILHETAVSEMFESGWDLSLYTCTNDRVRRLTIRCNEIKP